MQFAPPLLYHGWSGHGVWNSFSLLLEWHFIVCLILGFYIFNLDVDVSEESPPPLPERTPESFVLASEHSEYLFYMADVNLAVIILSN